MVINEGSDQRFVETLKGIIEEHIDDTSFSTEQLCRAVGLSRSQLYRRVKAATSLSLSLFIRQVRLQKAQDLLTTTDLTIAEVAYQCGISSPQNFTKYFTAAFGVNPSDFRKQQESQSDDLEVETRKTENKVLPVAVPYPVSKPSGVSEKTTDELPQKPLQKDAGRRLRWILISLIVLVFVVVSMAYSGLFRQQVPASPGPYADAPSIAVIPFKDYHTADGDFLSEGVVEDILTHLAKFQNLRVISRTSTERYRNTEKSIQQIAAELGVSYVLEGSIRQSDGKIRITAQLIEAAVDRHIWAKNYDRTKENVMEIQSEVALDIARALNQEISPEVQQIIRDLPTDNAEAYHALLRGRHLLRTREKNALEASIKEFDEALRLDPHFSDAYTGKAAAYYLLRDSYFNAKTASFHLQEAEKNALRAIKEDSKNAQAFAYLGLLYQAQYNWEEALTVFEIALNLNPSDALINYWYGNLFRTIGKLDEALRYQRIAYDLDPLYPVIHAGYSYTSVLAGQYGLAEDLLDQGKLIFKNSFLHETTRGLLHLLQGEYEAAIEDLDRSLSYNPDFGTTKIIKVYCQGRSGDRAAVEAYLATLDTNQPNDCLRAAEAYLSLGEEAMCITLMRAAADQGRIDTDILIDKRYKPILYHPTVLQILREFRLYQYLPIQQ